MSRRHDRVVRWLAGWLQDGRTESDVLVEQIAPSAACPDGRLDLTLEAGGRRVRIEVAIVAAQTSNATAATRWAKVSGAAARDVEMDKKRRYAGLATPFVLEALSRPGDCACGALGSTRTMPRLWPLRTRLRHGSLCRQLYRRTRPRQSWRRVAGPLRIGHTPTCQCRDGALWTR